MPNGDVLVIGGFTGESLSDAERYHPTKGTWSKIFSFPSGIYRAYRDPAAKWESPRRRRVSFRQPAVCRAKLYDPVTGRWTHTGT